jgi:hypothetical protein
MALQMTPYKREKKSVLSCKIQYIYMPCLQMAGLNAQENTRIKDWSRRFEVFVCLFAHLFLMKNEEV